MSAEIAFLVAFLASPKALQSMGKPSLQTAVCLDPSIIEGTSPQRLVSILHRFTRGETQ